MPHLLAHDSKQVKVAAESDMITDGYPQDWKKHNRATRIELEEEVGMGKTFRNLE
jgi:hypothetical protein